MGHSQRLGDADALTQGPAHDGQVSRQNSPVLGRAQPGGQRARLKKKVIYANIGKPPQAGTGLTAVDCDSRLGSYPVRGSGG